MTTLTQDLKFALRTFAKSPDFTAGLAGHEGKPGEMEVVQ